MSDLIERLRDKCSLAAETCANLRSEAADEIESIIADRYSWIETAKNLRHQREKYADELAALREAARKVTCRLCANSGSIAAYFIEPTRSLEQITACPDCADLRAMLGETTWA